MFFPIVPLWTLPIGPGPGLTTWQSSGAAGRRGKPEENTYFRFLSLFLNLGSILWSLESILKLIIIIKILGLTSRFQVYQSGKPLNLPQQSKDSKIF